MPPSLQPFKRKTDAAVAKLTKRVRERADAVGSEFVTDARIGEWIRQSLLRSSDAIVEEVAAIVCATEERRLPVRLKTDAQVRRALSPSAVKQTARELEDSIQDRIIEALEALGCLVERRGEAGGRGGKGGGAFKTGEPDLRVSFRGRTFGIEVKRDAKEPLRKDQVEWYRKNAANVPYFVCCDHRQALMVWEMFTSRIADERLLRAFDYRIDAIGTVVLK